jgi:hypothetical protein
MGKRSSGRKFRHGCSFTSFASVAARNARLAGS